MPAEETCAASADAADTRGLAELLVSDPAQVPRLTIFEGHLGQAGGADVIRIYVSDELDEYLEFARAAVRLQRELGPCALDGVAVWVDAVTPVKHAWLEATVHDGFPGIEPALISDGLGLGLGESGPWQWVLFDVLAEDVPPPRRRRRPSWREWIREQFPVLPGEHRRHIVSYRYIKSFAMKLTGEQLRRLGYDPALLGGIEDARWAYIRDRFNDPRNFWRGDGWWNSWLGRMMARFEELNWDFPSPAEEARERERRDQEERDRLERERLERERREREERERAERERLERERREREERERLERERQERERREREERERQERERQERERRERERATRSRPFGR